MFNVNDVTITSLETITAFDITTGNFKFVLDELQRITGINVFVRGTLRSGNIEKIEQFVTRNGTKHLAHNSGLLTYYDRQGKIVELDESQKHRVLFGDKDVLKL